jgi:hypothetical protein
LVLIGTGSSRCRWRVSFGRSGCTLARSPPTRNVRGQCQWHNQDHGGSSSLQVCCCPTASASTSTGGEVNTNRGCRCGSRVTRVVIASTSGVVGCSYKSTDVANDYSPYCTEIVKRWPYYQSKIVAEKKALVCHTHRASE